MTDVCSATHAPGSLGFGKGKEVGLQDDKEVALPAGIQDHHEKKKGLSAVFGSLFKGGKKDSDGKGEKKKKEKRADDFDTWGDLYDKVGEWKEEEQKKKLDVGTPKTRAQSITPATAFDPAFRNSLRKSNTAFN